MRAGMRGALEAIGRIYGGSGLEGRDDFDLLARFATGGDERAFRALVERHGKMVMAVCRQVTRNAHDAEDAFQATFLVLARRAPGLWHRGTLAGWLHRVARRVAVEASRKRDLARKLDEAGARAEQARPDRDDLDWLPALHEEIDRLPEKYRSVVVLCDLEELTRDEAARRLGWPPGTVAGRLSRARARLRERLERRGLVPGGALVPAAMEVPEALVEAAVSAVVHPGSAAVAATLLAEGALMAMRFSLVRAVVVASVSCAALLAGGLAVAGGGGSPQEPPAAPPAPAAAVVVQERSARPFGIVSEVERPSVAVTPESERPEFEVLVVDSKTKQPVPGATVRVYTDPGEHWFETGPDGVARGIRPERSVYEVTVDAWGPTHQNTRRGWSNKPGHRLQPLEPRVTIEVAPGELTVGGRVVDEEGRPIEGVVVELSGMREGESWLDFFDFTAMTDAEGLWSSRAMPASLSKLRAEYYHPDYLQPVHYASEVAAVARRFAEMKTRDHVEVLKKGKRLEGRVVDQKDEPVAGAIVKRAYHPGMSEPEAKTGPDGRFVFPAAPDTRYDWTLLTFAPGLAPDLRPLAPGDLGGPLEIRLGPGRTIRGKAVDESGMPIAEAQVYTRKWGRCEMAETVALTDRDGRFAWTGGPGDSIEVVPIKPGFTGAEIACPPGAEEQQWMMEAWSQIRLRVTDARTGRPIPLFQVLKGQVAEGGTIKWEEFDAQTRLQLGYNGQAIARLDAGTGDWILRVVVPGYRPSETRMLDSSVGEMHLDLKLEPLEFGEGGGPSGVVVDEEGRPVVGAEVALASKGKSAALHGDSWRRSQGDLDWIGLGTLVTDAQGRFTFSPIEGSYALGAVHPTGYGEVSSGDGEFARSGRIVLRPWGRIEGRVMAGGKPRPGAGVTVEKEAVLSPGPITPTARAVCDAEGWFVVDRMAPGDYQAIVRVDGEMKGEVYFSVAPGETARPVVEGQGRTLVGRVVHESPEGALTSSVMVWSDRPTAPDSVALDPVKRSE